MYVSKGTLVYNGGGLQTKGSGANLPNIENHGNFMIVSNTSSDVFRNLDDSGAENVAGISGTFVNKLNEETAYASVNPDWDPGTPGVAPIPVYTYGQLFIDGISQGNIRGVVNQEFRQPSHGSYQQMGFPFYDKTISTLSGAAGLGKTFSNTRYSGNEILYWNNTSVVSANLPNGLNTKLGVDLSPFSYFIVGGSGLNVSTQTRTLVGRPVATTAASLPVTLGGAGANLNFGTNGFGLNQYNEYYNTYLQDSFDTSAGVWLGNFGKNIYQFGNPYMTNLDLSQIATAEANGDGNNLSNIYGIRLEVQGVQYNSSGGGSTTFKSVTFASGVPTGDVTYAMVRPMGTFVVKLKSDLAVPESLNFATLRRFNYHRRLAGTAYGVTAAKNTPSGTVKQLGVIGLDANGNEVDRTYYVVSPNTISGHTSNPTIQVTASNSFGTYEENAVNGGYDPNYFSYWLYINEANETNFKGKNIKLVNYNPNIVSFKFEIRENAEEIAAGAHLLSSGEGFYYKKGTETSVSPALQGSTVASQAGTNSGIEYDLYYGMPTNVTLGANEIKRSSRTLVVYNPETNGYFVRFDPSWKTATVEVYDLSGKLILSKKEVNASRDYVLDLAKDLKIGYLVTIVSDKGEKVTSKIVK
ncbi:T9SS type A sorting domain-containing protein [Chryseobacterium wangxinyae]|uniref:T9SS type A sorting domain-containing protein n=1 Tax=Chryseobacterium sp. CY350 TaxID=2997336 RepID=UPI00226D59CE|nr:T9SS type A sorting domain-containing protein [Chryseobacterium sp. CY350]MCY0979215.1 T9SS type A sorting domain-containing protein [Chryseobacterium sp. CY350]WBZ94788.1 T9SS type A sorting domain-containing protein [Chryseobacterium sp. CY350]